MSSAMSSAIAKIDQAREVVQIADMIKQMADAITKSANVAEQAMIVASESKQELTTFKNSVQDVLERQNRIDSNQIRIIRRTVEERIRYLVKQIKTDNPEQLKRRFFSRCYRSIHDACLVSTITDIPQKLYDHALRAAKEWEPTGTES